MRFPRLSHIHLSRIFVGALALMMVFTPLLADVVYAQNRTNPAAGAGGGLPVGVLGDAGRLSQGIWETVYQELTKAAVIALVNGMQTFLGQLAYDAADYIATGGKGQGTAFYQKSFGQYLEDVASDSAGEFIGSLSTGTFFQRAGVNLCKPDLKTLLRIQLSLGNFYPGMQGRFQRPRPRCDFKDVINNYRTFSQTLSGDELLNNIQLSFNPNSNDLGVTFAILNQFNQKIALDTSKASLDRQEGQGFKTISGIISGNIKTPSQVVSEEARDTTVRFPKQSLISNTNAVLANAFELGAAQLLSYTASVFLNTLASKLLHKLFEEGLDLSPASLQLLTNPDEVGETSKTDSRSVLVSLKTPNLQKVSQFDVVSQMIACPPSQRSAWNCVMDQSLKQAVQPREGGGMTVAAAMGREYLHPDWRLIPSAQTRENQDPNCYTQAYCSSNLQKMRIMRILPVGFEFAADSLANIARCADGNCVTLREVVDGFNDCDPGTRTASESHPWCHLIDPNWTLTVPLQQCAVQGYGNELLSSALGQRKEECQDIRTCLKRDDRGECVGGYGYCLAEKTVYRFGADECPARYASCRTYQSHSGSSVSYVRNTLDYDRCTADNVGCYWYATTRDLGRGEDAWIGTPSTGPRVYFDRGMEACASSDEGCTKLKVVQAGQPALNLVLNPSFESETTASPASLREWSPARPASTPVVSDGTSSWTGSHAADIGTASITYEQTIEVVGSRSYSLTFYARSKNTSVPADARALFVQYEDQLLARPISDAILGTMYRSSSCRPTPGIGILEPRDGRVLDATWRRFECDFVTAPATKFGRLSFNGSNVLIDGVQLEEGEFATAFVDGLNTGLSDVHLRVAPEGLTCRGESTDPSICGKFARTCGQREAGCEGYTDVRGAPEVPAIVSSNDRCPAECVGYASYQKAASSFDLVHESDPRFDDPTDADPAYFIPSTGESCTQDMVGCEAFTNVQSAAAGGEGQAFFSYVRSCRLPGPDSKTFFTWEGSDSAGYQLRTWSLARDSATPAGPLIVAKRVPGQSFFKEPATCDEATWRTGVDPDCRQFYDAEGAVYYRYYSQTVLATDQCTDFRLSRTNRDDCEKTDGVFTPSTGECVYHVYVPGSQLCRSEAVGCRAYRGAGSGRVERVFSEHFSLDATSTFVGGRVSPEALRVGDGSLRLDVSSGGTVRSSAVFPSTSDDLYTVSFWAKSPATRTPVQVYMAKPDDAPDFGTLVGTVELSSDWQRFVMGPFTSAHLTEATRLTWALPGRPQAYIVFIDEVEVQHVQDVAYVLRDSWRTPAVCDQTASGALQPQAMLGCQSYRTRSNTVETVRQFTRLCRQEAIGCKAFVDTRNSDNVARETFVRADEPYDARFGASTTTRPADRYVYLIDEPSKRCNASSASCRAFGRPNFAADRQSIADFETVYIKDDITRYESGLCRPSELFCEEFTYNGSREFFHDPGTHACEYREGVEDVSGVPAGRYSGWFQVGVTPLTPCYPERLISGQTFGIALHADTGYQQWGGLCPSSAGECTELRDANDLSDASHPLGRPYYFVKNQRLDTSSCAGNVDVGGGCILVRDTSDSQSKYNAAASYARYQQSNSRPVSPVDCVADPTNAFCAALPTLGRCTGTITECIGGDCGSGGRASTFEEEEPRFMRVDPSLERYFTCHVDADCIDDVGFTHPGLSSFYRRSGTCAPDPKNDSNLIVKVQMDRDCSQWLGCSSAETVLDPSTNRYKDLCTNVALCDRATGQSGDIYCASYVDRTTVQKEPILTQGKFFDASTYISRNTGLGKSDYAGYAIPNAFLVPDLVNTRVAIDGLPANEDVANRYARDYRLAAAVRMPPHHAFSTVETVPVSRIGISRFIPRPSGTDSRVVRNCPPGAICYVPDRDPVLNEAVILDQSTDMGSRYPSLHLCVHLQTDQIGYFRPSDVTNSHGGLFCYFPIQGKPQRSTVSSPFDFQMLAEKFTNLNPDQDVNLRKAFPSPECRTYPEADAPFSNDVVTEWDLGRVPPKIVARASGYSQAHVCEYGEDCACTYKRADYSGGAISKFFAADSQNIPTGICQGGPRSGESCIPGSVFSGGAPAVQPQDRTLTTPATPGRRAVEPSDSTQNCGPVESGGSCIALSKLDLIRGLFGQCLERDDSRNGLRGIGDSPCLTWSPTPILFGDKDIFHYVPGSGYSPPPSSGQYYCTSYARKPLTVTLSKTQFIGSDDKDHPLAYAGGMTKLDYDDLFTSDEDEDDRHQISSSLTGSHTANSQVAQDCEEADDLQDGNSLGRDALGLTAYQAQDPFGLRIVGTGLNYDESYAETFFRINPKKLTTLISGVTNPSPLEIGKAISDMTIGAIRIEPFRNPNGTGRLFCGYQTDWVDGMPDVHPDSSEELTSQDVVWRKGFLAKYNPQLSRSSEKILMDNDGHPRAMPCVTYEGSPSGQSECYFKTWETTYRSDGQEQLFSGLRRLNFMSLNTNPYYATCESSKPYFGIRAVFQADASLTAQNGTPRDRFTSSIRPGGPWSFVGFWVGACAGTANDVRYIYMKIDVTSADVCKEIAEVRSSRSNQDAAFTDRVWKNGSFSVPDLGLQYTNKFSPFSSILNNSSIKNNDDALLQTGNTSLASGSSNARALVASGSDTYYREGELPKDKWAYLSNLFARVYRIYQYHQRPVGLADRACLDGPFKGMACELNDRSLPETAISASASCSLNGVCDTQVHIGTAASDTYVCDSGSGLNAGLSCASDPDICHTGAILGGDPSNQALSPCVLNRTSGISTAEYTEAAPGGWRENEDHTYDNLSTVTVEHYSARDAANYYATIMTGVRWLTSGFAWTSATPGPRASSPFICRYGARQGMDCTTPSSASRECPVFIMGRCTHHGDRSYPYSYVGSDGYGLPSTAVPAAGRCSFPELDELGNPVLDRSGNVVYHPASEAYSPCHANYDCSFTDYNYYMKRQAPAQNLYSTRSAALSGRSTCNDGTSDRGGYCLDSFDVRIDDYDDCAISASDPPSSVFFRGSNAGHCTLQAYREGSDSQRFRGGDSDNLCNSSGYQPRLLVGAYLRYTPSELTRFPGLSRTSVIGRFGVECDGESGATWERVPFGKCVALSGLSASRSSQYGRCRGGVYDGRVCSSNARAGTRFSCEVDMTQPVGVGGAGYQYPVRVDDLGADGRVTNRRIESRLLRTVRDYENIANRCGPVSYPRPDGRYVPVAECAVSLLDRDLTGVLDVETDNNICTHGAGYRPRLDICPDPSDEFCGLIAYKRGDPSSLDPTSPFHLPTDVTMGHYTPNYLGFTSPSYDPVSAYRYISYYTPRPPQVAAIDPRQCTIPGQCLVQRLDGFTFNGRSFGSMSVASDQHKSTIQFYAWAAHEQMPIRQLALDWGDGFTQEFPDARIKNHKPFCGVTKECVILGGSNSGPTGLTCSTDSDCPPGLGRCQDVGTCAKNAAKVCSRDSDCSSDIPPKDVCNIRTFFGNSPDACDPNYFEFSHLYTCTSSSTVGGVPCADSPRLADGTYGPPRTPYNEKRCSRNPAKICSADTDCAAGDTCVEGLAPPGGCWDPALNTCRFTPRLLIQDNWGWCTGECRNTVSSDGQLQDGGTNPPVTHRYGGCYAGATLGATEPNVRTNVPGGTGKLIESNECKGSVLPGNLPDTLYLRPWLVYPGGVQLRASR